MTPLLLSLLIYAVAGNHAGSPCQYVSLGSCEPDPSSIVHLKSGVTVQDCQLLCQIFSHCTVFQHQEQDNTCILLSTDYRLASCSTITSPTFRPGEDNIFAACQEAIAGNPNTCEGFIEENCTMDTQPQGDIAPGEIATAEDCSHICSIEQFAFFSFSLAQESTCSCFTSSSRTCHDIGGPPHPDMDSCSHTSTTTTTTSTSTTTTPEPGNKNVILVTGGVVPGFLPGVSPPHVTNTTEVLGSYCLLPNLPYSESEDGICFDAPGHITVLTPDLDVLSCGGYFDDDDVNREACYSLDLASQTWVHHSNVPMTLGSSAVVLDDGVYMMGFFNIFCEHDCLTNYYMHLPVGSSYWFKRALSDDLSLAIDMGACAVATSAWTFLVIGGGTDQVLEYDSRNSSWSLWAPLAQKRSGHACAMLSDKVIIAGGMDHNTTTTILNLKTKEEHPGGDLLTARHLFGLIMVDNKLFAMGGSDCDWGDIQDTDNVNLFTEVWDEEGKTWAVTDNIMSTPRAGFGHATVPLATVCP